MEKEQPIPALTPPQINKNENAAQNKQEIVFKTKYEQEKILLAWNNTNTHTNTQIHIHMHRENKREKVVVLFCCWQKESKNNNSTNFK